MQEGLCRNGVKRKKSNIDYFRQEGLPLLSPLFELVDVNPLRANITKWSNTLKQFVGSFATNCLSVFDHFVILKKATEKWIRKLQSTCQGSEKASERSSLKKAFLKSRENLLKIPKTEKGVHILEKLLTEGLKIW